MLINVHDTLTLNGQLLLRETDGLPKWTSDHPQESVLGHFLYPIFTVDMPTQLMTYSAVTFEDNTTVVRRITVLV